MPSTSSARPLFVVMLGGVDGDGAESLMRSALEASAFDLLQSAAESDRYGDRLLVTDRAPDGVVPDAVRVLVDDELRPFHFGERLTTVVAEAGAGRFVYAGAGAGPLLTSTELMLLADELDASDQVCVSNNFYSADLFAVRPASLLSAIDPWPPADNGVPRALREQHEVEAQELPRTIATQLNLDTPVDLMAFALCQVGGPRLGALLRERVLDTSRVAEASRRFTEPQAEVLVAGRASAQMWRYLETETACRIRILGEERGMTAAGRDADGSARSLLGQLIEAIGPERCFTEAIPDLCDAAFIDLRPALAHLGIHASRADRFAADLGAVDQIEDPRLQALVAATNASPVPIVLGGHSLVAGALMLLNQWAWDEHDRLVTEGQR